MDEYHPIYPEMEPILINGRLYHNVSRKKMKIRNWLKGVGWPEDKMTNAQLKDIYKKGNKRKGKIGWKKFTEIYLRDNALCHYCKRHLNVCDATIDHKIPVSKGGNNALENLLLCCSNCNNDKSDLDYDEYIFIVHIEKRTVK